jgi:hypothetical protein
MTYPGRKSPFSLTLTHSAALAIFALACAAGAHAAPSAATICPPFNFINATNHALNPSFETIGANGNPSICPAPCVAAKESAAAN